MDTSNNAASNAVRLAADAVVKAADKWDRVGKEGNELQFMDAEAKLAAAIEAHRKAKAEQAKEASRG